MGIWDKIKESAQRNIWDKTKDKDGNDILDRTEKSLQEDVWDKYIDVPEILNDSEDIAEDIEDDVKEKAQKYLWDPAGDAIDGIRDALFGDKDKDNNSKMYIALGAVALLAVGIYVYNSSEPTVKGTRRRR